MGFKLFRKRKDKNTIRLAALLGLSNLVLVLLYLAHAYNNLVTFAGILLRDNMAAFVVSYTIPIVLMAVLFYASYSVLKGRKEHRVIWWVCFIIAIIFLYFGAYIIRVGNSTLELSLGAFFLITCILAIANSVYHLHR